MVKLGIRIGLLIAFPTLVDTTPVFVNKVLSVLQCVLGAVALCLAHGGFRQNGGNA